MEIDETENRKSIGKINEAQSWSFELNGTSEPPATLTRGKEGSHTWATSGTRGGIAAGPVNCEKEKGKLRNTSVSSKDVPPSLTNEETIGIFFNLSIKEIGL